jgi:hypothetical protein
MPACAWSSSGSGSGGRSTTKVPLTVGPVACMAANDEALVTVDAAQQLLTDRCHSKSIS